MSKSRPPQAGVTRKHLARAERDALYQKWIIRITIGVAVVIVALLGYGWLDTSVLQLRRPVAKVGGVEISTGQFQKAVRYTRLQTIEQAIQIQNYIGFAQAFGADEQTIGFYQQQLNSMLTQLEQPEAMGRQVIDELIDEEIIRQEAQRRGITVSQEEIDRAVEEGFGYYREGTPTPLPTFTPAPTNTPAPTATLDPSQTPTASATATGTPVPTATPTAGPSPTPRPTATPFTFEGFQTLKTEFLTDATKNSGLTDADYRALVEASLLRKKLIEAFGADISDEIVTAHVRHILVDDEAIAKGIIVQLQQGEDFAELAKIFSTDTSNKDTGGDLGTADEGAYVEEFGAVAFDPDVPLGLYPQPVKTTFGYHVIDVIERGSRTLTEAELQTKRTEVFNEWLTTQRTNLDIVEELNWQLHVPTNPTIQEVIESRPTDTPEPTTTGTPATAAP